MRERMSARCRRPSHRPRPGARGRAWLLVLTLAGVACGGNVVVDPPPHGASGSGNGTGASGSTTSSGAGASITTGSTGNAGGAVSSGGGGAGGGGCNPVVTPPEMSVMGCIQSSFCPQPSEADTTAMLTLELGYCNVTTQPCCGKTVIDHVTCGPIVQGGLCCYTVLSSTAECGDGG
jgi:hypothetical protein